MRNLLLSHVTRQSLQRFVRLCQSLEYNIFWTGHDVRRLRKGSKRVYALAHEFQRARAAVRVGSRAAVLTYVVRIQYISREPKRYRARVYLQSRARTA